MDEQRPKPQYFDPERFRILVECSLDTVVLVDRDRKVLYVTPSIARLVGYTAEEVVQSDAFRNIHPGDRDIAVTRFAELLQHPDNSDTAVHRIQHKDGTWRWVESVTTNHLELPGIESMVMNLRDVTSRKQAMDAARVAEEQFRFIVESATEFAIFTTDLDGRVNSWNSGASRILGYNEEEILGQDCRIFFTPEDNVKDQADAEMRNALVHGRGNDERWHVRKDGSRFWGSGLMMPLRDDEGTIHGYLKIFRDMTREKRAEQALQEANRRKDEFLAILAHELRNPLAAISNAGSLLLTPVNENEWAKQVILRQSRHLARLLDDLLDVSRITQGKMRLHQERFDLSTAIGKAIELVRPLMQDKKHNLALVVVPGPTTIFGDPTRIEQVIVNLLTNAVKYTDDGGRISVTVHRGDEAIVTVTDTGIGIPAEMHEQLFQLFVQVDRSLERNESGLGIGLSLARSIVEMHGGKIWVKSEGPQKGSEFGFSLPLASQ